MASSKWRITYNGVRDSISDAGLTFDRGVPVETEDQDTAMYFTHMRRFTVVEFGPVADEKKDSLKNNEQQTKKTDSTGSEKPQEDVVAEVNTPAPTPIVETNDSSTEPESEPAHSTEVSVEEVVTPTIEPVDDDDDDDNPDELTKPRRKGRKKTSDKVKTSDFLASELLSPDDLK